jgi:dehydrogenase/reductase SDR family protein 7B
MKSHMIQVQPMDWYTNKVVWVTGASSGIGEALARLLLSKGAKVILSARREAELVRVARESKAKDGSAYVIPLDLSDLDALPGKAEQAFHWQRDLDVVIHNGGVSQRALALETSVATDLRLMAVNYFGAVVLTKALLPGMLARQKGHIVVISSVVGKFGTPLRSGYAASKHALHGFFDSLRAEVAGTGIKITLVCPGYVRTNVSIAALRGDGTPYQIMDRDVFHGISAEECARDILKQVGREKNEAYIGGRETYAVYLKRFFPDTFAWLLGGYHRRRSALGSIE